MVDIEHLMGMSVVIIAYGLIIAPLLTQILNNLSYVPTGLTAFFIYLIVPVFGLRILYVTVMGGRREERR